jgi:hypothetical protein
MVDVRGVQEARQAILDAIARDTSALVAAVAIDVGEP